MKLFVGNTPVIVDPFFAQLFKLFPDRPFEVYPDSPGVWVWYPKYGLWPEYKRGEKVGDELRKGKTTIKKALDFLKRVRKMPDKTRKQAYKKLLAIAGFAETFGQYNIDVGGKVSWKRVRGEIRFQINEYIDVLVNQSSIVRREQSHARRRGSV